MRKMIIAIVVMILSSCLNITQEVTLKPDMSGDVKTTVTIDKNALALMGGDEDTLKNLPSKKEDFADVDKTLSMIDFKFDSNDDEQMTQTQFAFKNIADIAKLSSSNFAVNVKTKKSGANTVITYTFISQKTLDTKNKNSKMPQDKKKVALTILKDYYLTLIINAPSPIRSASTGQIDKNKLTYKMSLDKIIDLQKPVIIKLTI